MYNKLKLSIQRNSYCQIDADLFIFLVSIFSRILYKDLLAAPNIIINSCYETIINIPLINSNEPSLRALEHKNQIDTSEKYAYDSFMTIKKQIYTDENNEYN